MFSIVEPKHRPHKRELLDAMHKKRYDVVVGEWGWTIPGITPGYDEDQFDTDDTVYILVENAQNKVVASTRLNPTTKPHMMSEIFQEFCDLQPVPRDKHIWECSRFVVDRRCFSDPVSEYRARSALAIGMTQYCLANDIHSITWLTHSLLYNSAAKIWRTEPLGLPKPSGFDNWTWQAAVSEISESSLAFQTKRHHKADKLVSKFYSTGPLSKKRKAA